MKTYQGSKTHSKHGKIDYRQCVQDQQCVRRHAAQAGICRPCIEKADAVFIRIINKHICSRKSAQKNVLTQAIHTLSLHLALQVSFAEVLFSIPYLLPVHHLVNSSLLKGLYG